MKSDPTDKVVTLEFLSQLGLGVRATNVLFRMGVKSASQFTALDEQTLTGRRNCGKKTAAEIMQAITRYKPLIEATSEKKVGTISPSAAMQDTSVADLHLSLRAMRALEHLKISTVGQLARVSDQELLDVSNFGKKSLREVRSKLALFHSREFVVWPTEQQTADGLNRYITRLALKLQRLRNASTILHDDCRYGHLVRQMGLSEAKNAREAADMIVSRKADPINPQILIARLTDLVRNVLIASRMSLEAELWSLTNGLGSDRNRRIIMSHLGWGGKPPKTLEVVGQMFKITRERVRQICTRIENVRSSKPFAPVLDRVLRTAAHAAPMRADEIEGRLVQRSLTNTGFSIESLIAAAKDLGANFVSPSN